MELEGILPTQPVPDVVAEFHAVCSDAGWNALQSETPQTHEESAGDVGSLHDFSEELAILEAWTTLGGGSDGAGEEVPPGQPAASLTPQKKRRLLVKQPSPYPSMSSEHGIRQDTATTPAHAARPTVRDNSSPGSSSESSPASSASNELECVYMTPEQRRHYKRFHKSFTYWLAQTKDTDSWIWSAAAGVWKGFLGQSQCVQVDMVQAWAATCRLGSPAKEWALDWAEQGNFGCGAAGRRKGTGERKLDSKTILLTYQGDFGVWPAETGDLPSLPPARTAITASDGLAADLIHGNKDVVKYIDDVVRAVRDTAKFQVLRTQAELFLAAMLDRLKGVTTAWSLELCTKSLLEKDEVRVHAHFYLSRENGKITVRTNEEPFAFMGVQPHASPMKFLRQRSSTAAAGLLYCTAEGKYGLIATGSSCQAHRDYVVQPQWVLNMMAMGKMSLQAAREHLVKQGRDLPRLLASIDAYAEERKQLSLQKHMKEVVAALKDLALPFVSIPEVDAWVEAHKVLRWRYPFLVLVGAIMLGKQGIR